MHVPFVRSRKAAACTICSRSRDGGERSSPLCARCCVRVASVRDRPSTRKAPMHRPPHILNAATNLLGICFIIIGGLKLANQSSKTYSDEGAWAAAVLLLVSIIL